MRTPHSAELRWAAEPDSPKAVVLVLHGGREHSTAPVRWRQPPVVRMLPFARAVARAGDGQIAVARLRHTVRGWNGDEASPVVDAREALDQIRARYPNIPIGLLGHSMGGRTALYLADEPDVTALVGLAPWVTREDTARGGPALAALLMHGTRDRITNPRATRRMSEAMQARGVRVTWRPVSCEGHAMLRVARMWHRESARFLRRALLGPPAA